MSRARGEMYANLIDHLGITLKPKPNENTVSYISEALSSYFETRFPNCKSALTIGQTEAIVKRDSISAETLENHPIAGYFYADETHVVNVQALRNELRAYDRRILPSILSEIEHHTAQTSATIGPCNATWIAEYNYFYGDPKEWFECILETIAENEDFDGRNPNLKARQYIRENNIRTPWRLRSEIGHEFVQYSERKKKFSNSERDAAIDRLPKPLKEICRTLIDATVKLGAQQNIVNALLSDDERQLTRGDGVFRIPELIIDSTSNYEIEELVNDIYDQLGSEGSDIEPNCIFLLPRDPAQAEAKLTTAIEAFAQSTECIKEIVSTLTTYQTVPTKKP